jgi:putative sterol carrier protein
MSVLAEAIAQRLAAQLAKEPGLDKVLKFDLGPDGVVVIDGTAKPNRVSTEDRAADCTMGMTAEGLRKVVMGELDLSLGYLLHLRRLEGDRALAMKVQPIIRRMVEGVAKRP